MSLLTRPLWLLAMALVILGAAGCNPNVSEDENFQKLTKRVDLLAEDVKAGKFHLSSHDKDIKDFQQVSRDVAQMMKGGGPAGSTDATKALEQRVQRLEATVNELNQRLAAQRGVALDKAGQAEAGVAATTGDGARAKGKLAITRKGGARKRKGANVDASLNPDTGAEAGAGTDADGATAQSAKRGGSYYDVRAGDTLRKIAAKNGVTVSAILAANSLPAGAKVAAGTSLYIPKP